MTDYFDLTDFKTHSEVGVMISGGADSALLSYLLLTNSTQKLHFFTLASKQKHSHNATASVYVLSELAKLTNNYNFEHHITYTPKQNSEILLKNAAEYLDKKAINIVYSGLTANPPVEVTNQFTNPIVQAQDRTPGITRNKLINQRYLCPFINLTKQDIYELYKEFKLLDSVFPLTRSCERVDDEYQHCGKCWWCEERLWAFGCLT